MVTPLLVTWSSPVLLPACVPMSTAGSKVMTSAETMPQTIINKVMNV